MTCFTKQAPPPLHFFITCPPCTQSRSVAPGHTCHQKCRRRQNKTKSYSASKEPLEAKDTAHLNQVMEPRLSALHMCPDSCWSKPQAQMTVSRRGAGLLTNYFMKRHMKKEESVCQLSQRNSTTRSCHCSLSQIILCSRQHPVL